MATTLATVRDLEKEFTEDLKEFYPGSSRPVVRHPNRNDRKTKVAPSSDDEPSWQDTPRKFTADGLERPFYTTGHIAQALGRKPGTIRKWEADGVLPQALWNSPHTAARGRRRLYTRDQVEGIARIAEEEGLTTNHFRTMISKTNFTPRVVELFQRLGRTLPDVD